MLLLLLPVRDVEDSGDDGECRPQSTESAAGVERAMPPPLRNGAVDISAGSASIVSGHYLSCQPSVRGR